MLVFAISSKVRVDHRRSVYDMCMREKTDTAEVAAEQHQKKTAGVCSKQTHNLLSKGSQRYEKNLEFQFQPIKRWSDILR